MWTISSAASPGSWVGSSVPSARITRTTSGSWAMSPLGSKDPGLVSMALVIGVLRAPAMGSPGGGRTRRDGSLVEHVWWRNPEQHLATRRVNHRDFGSKLLARFADHHTQHPRHHARRVQHDDLPDQGERDRPLDERGGE